MVENHQSAQFHPPVRYIVSFPEPRAHYAFVEACLPAGDAEEIEVFMPVWTPGSYLVREYARNIEAILATNPAGQPLPFVKSSKNRWKIQTGGASGIRLNYRVYCREMSVRTNWVEDGFALLNGAPTFVTSTGLLDWPHEVQIDLPSHWTITVTGLPEAPNGPSHRYLAQDYDALVDSPILSGNPAVYHFEVDGIAHFLVNEGEAGVWDGPRSASDCETIVRRYRDMWGSLPYQKYVFLNLLTESPGGLEHGNSVCLMSSRWATRTRGPYLRWLNLVSHEFFHVWNIKRLRPAELGPFDYERENYTRSLWIAEGITDYYAALTVRRSGLSDTAEYLASLSEVIQALQSTPGRLVQSAEESSFDAWIKLYRPDENSVNTSVSYYTKGTAVAWILDALIRQSTSGARSLDDVMRLAFERFSGERGFTTEEFKALAGEVAGVPLGSFFSHAVEAAAELDYTPALDWFGLRFKNVDAPKTCCVIGAETRIDNGRLLVKKIPRGTRAAESGLNVDDEIIAIDEFRVRPDQLSQRLENYRPGDKVTLLVARRDAILRIGLVLSAERKLWQLEILPDATGAQKRNLARWLGL